MVQRSHSSIALSPCFEASSDGVIVSLTESTVSSDWVGFILPSRAPTIREMRAIKTRCTIENPVADLDDSFFLRPVPVDRFLFLLKSFESSSFFSDDSLDLSSDFSV